MSKYDFIADIGRNSPRPIAAFLVGREQKRERERQEQIDALNAENIESVIAFRAAQAKAMNAPPKPGDKWVDLTPEQKQALRIPDTSFAQRNTTTGQVKIDDAPGPLVKNTVNTGDQKGTSIVDLPSDMRKSLDDSYKTAQSDYAAYKAADDSIQLIDDGIFAGMAAGGAELVARMASLVSDKDNPPEKIAMMLRNLARSQEYDAKTGILVGAIIKLFGSGTGLSDADREFAREIVGAVRSKEPGALRNILMSVRDQKRSDLEAVNKRIDSFGNIGYSDVAQFYSPFDLGDAKDAEWYLNQARQQ